jgi:hypothetical protein
MMDGLTATPKTLNSSGYVAVALQVMPQTILATARRLNITPAMTLNGIAHFDDQQVERIAEALRQNRSKE